MSSETLPPVVLAISGNDPSGGAGIQADIEAVASLGCHCAPVITTLTVQDTRNAWRVEPLPPGLVIEQAEAVLADLDVAAIKLGLLGDVDIARAVAALLARHPAVPVVLDPVLIAGGGARLAEQAITGVMVEELVPRALFVTPNSDEARALAPGADTLDGCAQALVARGARFVLLKGAHEETERVVNSLFSADGQTRRLEWPRLPGRFHGSGCTLASALAALVARGTEALDAAERAQRYVHDALENGYRIGRGQAVPDRMFHPVPRR